MKKENTDINQNASKSYKQPKKLNVNDPNHYFNLGNAYFEQQEYNIAVKYYERAIELDSANALYYVNLGITHVKLKNYEEAIECNEQVLTLNSKNTILFNYIDVDLDNQLKEAQDTILVGHLDSSLESLD